MEINGNAEGNSSVEISSTSPPASEVSQLDIPTVLLSNENLGETQNVATEISCQSSVKDDEVKAVTPDDLSVPSSSHTSDEQLTGGDCAPTSNEATDLTATEHKISVQSPEELLLLEVARDPSKEVNQESVAEEIVIALEADGFSPPCSSHSSDEQLTDGDSASILDGSSELRLNADSISVTSSDAPDQPQIGVTGVQNETSSSASHGQVTQDAVPRALIDTAAPFESVKAAVSKFGGIVDWKAHKLQTVERHKYVEVELEKAQHEVPEYKMQSEAAESAKAQVLAELNHNKRLIEELKLSLEKAQMEENQAKQDSELARLRVNEIEQGIANEASVAAKAQLEVARARHAFAVDELKSVREELEELKGQHLSAQNEKDLAAKRAEEAVSASKEVEKTVEELTLELIMAKESLESAHTAHLEAEEHRMSATMAKEQDEFNWERELKEAEEETQKLNEQRESVEELKSNLDAATQLLLHLKAELAAYMESKLSQETESKEKEEKLSEQIEETKQRQTSIQAAIASAKKELEEVRVSIEKAEQDVDFLKVAAVSLKSELEKEKAALTSMKQREGMASVAVASLEAELERTKEEIEMVQYKEREARESMVELPKALQVAAQEADQAKSVAKLAREELRKAKEEAEQAKAGFSTMQIRLHAAMKEIEAAKASERLALAAIKALQESETAARPDSPVGVTLSLEEYYELSKCAHEAEEQANVRVAAALAQIEVAKDSEAKSLEKLDAANEEMAERKEALKMATEKAEKAKEGKLGVEQELRKWRAEHEQRRKANDATPRAVYPTRSPEEEPTERKSSVGVEMETAAVQAPLVQSQKVVVPETNHADGAKTEQKVKKKRSFFPRIVMFLARRKTQSK
ncbi:protein WEAK CHLOROPLAST MOVEMENT UNDER BLUE LIGHT 1-like [Aristolochia californica]|uniref:protein WEAK CHLOROPLAST MOVEMENT UNDER BLUE LIGHT 1-like n=1 Tax=Aristolochia californica TaxID=171875 RepID=UPI0035DA2589